MCSFPETFYDPFFVAYYFLALVKHLENTNSVVLRRIKRENTSLPVGGIA